MPFVGEAPAARGCSIEEEKILFVGGAPAARGCWIANGRRLLLKGLPLRGADRKRIRKGCVWGVSRCAGLLD